MNSNLDFSVLIKKARDLMEENNYSYTLVTCCVRTDPAGNIEADKEKSTEKIDGAIATIMALDQVIGVGMTRVKVYMTTEGYLSPEIVNITIRKNKDIHIHFHTQ